MIRVSAYQTTPGATPAAKKAQLHAILSRADRECIDFVCFPEGFLTGYYENKSQAWENSLEVAGVLFQEWLAEFSPYRATVLVGFNERDGDYLFDSVAVIESCKLLGIQRKHYVYHNYFTPGSSYTAFWSKGIPFGIIICRDSNYFEPARLLALQDATILFCPACNKVPVQHPWAKRPPYYSQFVARAHENRCWLVAADWIWTDDGEIVCPGHSAIYDPDGREIARTGEGVEELLIVDIPKERLFQEKGQRVRGSPALQAKLASVAPLCRAVH